MSVICLYIYNYIYIYIYIMICFFFCADTHCIHAMAWRIEVAASASLALRQMMQPQLGFNGVLWKKKQQKTARTWWWNEISQADSTETQEAYGLNGLNIACVLPRKRNEFHQGKLLDNKPQSGDSMPTGMGIPTNESGSIVTASTWHHTSFVFGWWLNNQPVLYKQLRLKLC